MKFSDMSKKVQKNIAKIKQGIAKIYIANIYQRYCPVLFMDIMFCSGIFREPSGNLPEHSMFLRTFEMLPQ